jgi:hypothetical protein
MYLCWNLRVRFYQSFVINWFVQVRMFVFFFLVIIFMSILIISLMYYISLYTCKKTKYLLDYKNQINVNIPKYYASLVCFIHYPGLICWNWDVKFTKWLCVWVWLEKKVTKSLSAVAYPFILCPIDLKYEKCYKMDFSC